MKPTVTWILVANAKIIRAISNSGPGKGLNAVAGKTWQAPETTEYSDEPGVTQSSSGPGKASLSRPDIKRIAETKFAKSVMAELSSAHRASSFDRLVLVGAPHMLGTLRNVLPEELRSVVIAEVDKDLTHVPIDGLAKHLGDYLAV